MASSKSGNPPQNVHLFSPPNFYDKSQIPKLTDGDDFVMWKLDFLLYLCTADIDLRKDGHGNWSTDGFGQSPEEIDHKKKMLAWALLSALPRTWLLSYSSYREDGIALLQELESRFERNCTSERRRLLELKLLQVRYVNSADGYIHALLAAMAKFESCGGILSKERKVELLIGGLTPEFDVLKDSYDMDPTAYTWETACEKIRRKSDRISTARHLSAMKSTSTGRKKTFPEKSSSRTGTVQPAVSKEIICHHCKRPGHKRPNCPDLKKAKAKKSSKDHANVCFAGVNVDGIHRTDKDVWAYDSCATKHLTPHRSLLKDYEECTGSIGSYSKDECRIVGKGRVECFAFTTDGERIDISFEAFHCPGGAQNLLSSPLGKMRGHALIDTPENPHILLSNGKKIAVTVCQGLPVIRVEYENLVVSDEPSSDDVPSDSFAGVSLHRWHERFGHADYQMMKDLQKYVSGMKITSMTTPEVCDPCRMGKSRRQPFPKETTSRATKPGERIFVDIQGPLPAVSRQGNRHVIMWVDDATRFKFVYFMKRKSDAPKALKQFLIDCNHSDDIASMIIRSDEAPELTDGEFSSICEERGIQREETCADSPQQNGVAERSLATVTSDIRSLLVWSQLPFSFWEDALDYDVRCRNRTLSKATDRTPFELWHGYPPDISRFRVFGCLAYDWIPKDRRDKLSPTAKRMIFIGFKNGTKGYKLYNPETGKVRLSHDATFDETTPGGSLIPDSDDTPFDVDSEYTTEATMDENPTGDIDFDCDDPTPPVTSTRPARSRRKPGPWYIAGTAMLSYNKAMKSEDAPKWDDACKRELAALEAIGTWEPVVLPEGRKAIRSMWRFDIKRDKAGNVLRYKARLVARGDTQRAGLDYTEVFAPVASNHVLQLFCAIAVTNDWLLKHIDFTTAFLNAPLQEEIYMYPPPGMTLPDGHVLRLHRSLYGLKQAGRNWHRCLRDHLVSIGFRQLECDICIFIRHVENDYIAIAIHVDDLLVLVSNDIAFDGLMEELSVFKIGAFGDLDHYCGIAVERDHQRIVLSQGYYTRKIITDFCNTPLRSRATPVNEVRLSAAGELDELVDQKEYRKVVGSLLWLSGNTRPDIAFAVHQLSKYCSKPAVTHWEACKAVMRYLSGPPRGLVFDKSTPLQPIVYADADLGGDVDTRISTLGHCIFMAGGPVFWRSIRPKNVVLSSAEAEYCSQSEAARTILFLKNVLGELEIDLELPIRMFCDNQSAIAMANNLKGSMRTRHIDIKYHFVRQQVNDGVLSMDWISTSGMIADILTKPLKRILFTKFRNTLVKEVDDKGALLDASE